MAKPPVSAKLDEVDQAVLEAFLKQPQALPLVEVNGHYLDEVTVGRSLRKAAVRAAIQKYTADKVHAACVPAAVDFLHQTVVGSPPGSREGVGAAKALLVYAGQLEARQSKEGEDFGDLKTGNLKDILAECEAELARRAKPVKKLPEPPTAKGMFD